jgi:hypothetical protein
MYSNDRCSTSKRRKVFKNYEGVSKSFQSGRLERELQMVQLSATRCSFIAILWVSLVSFVAITLCVASQRVFVVVYYVIDSVRKLLGTLSCVRSWKEETLAHKSRNPFVLEVSYCIDFKTCLSWLNWRYPLISGSQSDFVARLWTELRREAIYALSKRWHNGHTELPTALKT